MTTEFHSLRPVRSDLINPEAAKHAHLREQLKQVYSLDDDDQALSDTLEGETRLNELCAEAIREAMMAENMADAVDTQIEKLKARKARFLHKCERLRQIVAEAMIEAGERKIVEADVTITVRDGKPKLVIDAERIPDRFKMPVTTFKPNKEAIQAAVDHGDVPEGVQISNATPVLQVRVK
jgi:hypothetical protein